MAQNFPIPLLVFRRYLFFLGFRRLFFLGSSLWLRGDHPHGFAECAHGGLWRSLISCFFVTLLAPLMLPIVQCLSDFLSLHARSWELDSSAVLGLEPKKSSKRREQNSFLGWSSALGVLGYWLGMTDPSLSSNLKVGLVTGSPPVPSFLRYPIPTVLPFELGLNALEPAGLWRKSWNSCFTVPVLHHALRFPILFANSFWD